MKRFAAILLCAVMSVTAGICVNAQDNVYEEQGEVWQPQRMSVPYMDGYHIVESENTTHYTGVDPNPHTLYIEDPQGNKITDEYREITVLNGKMGLFEGMSTVGHSDTEAEIFRISDGKVSSITDGPQTDSYYFFDLGEKSVYYSRIDQKYFDLEGKEVTDIDKYFKELGASLAYSDSAAEAVEKIKNDLIMPGELNYNFTSPITRRELCTLAMTVFSADLNRKNDTYRRNDYSRNIYDVVGDITGTDDYYMLAAAKLGFITDTDSGSLEPEKTVTRQEAAVFMYNIAKRLNVAENIPRTEYADDGDIAPWARESVYAVSSMENAEENRVMSAKDNNSFLPGEVCTREQMMASMVCLRDIYELKDREVKGRIHSIRSEFYNIKDTIVDYGIYVVGQQVAFFAEMPKNRRELAAQREENADRYNPTVGLT